MKFQQPPLRIDCSGLSKKRAMELADDLVELFDTVEYWDDAEIVCHKPRSGGHYACAWSILDDYGYDKIEVT